MSEKEGSSRETEFYYKLRKTVKLWAGDEKGQAGRYANYILIGPDLFMLMHRLVQDERLGQSDKNKLHGAMAYFINPLDFVPEAILGPAGLVDDVALAALVLHQTLEQVDPAIIREHWEGDADILDLIRQILDVADTMVGGPVWRRLVARAQSFASGA